MAAYISVALTWILFLALFPMSFVWLRRAWRIGMRHDYSEVALKRGESPADPQRWAWAELAINAAAGGVLVYVIVAVVVAGIPYDRWTAIAGTTIWCKFLFAFALGRHAHAGAARRR